MIKVIEVDNHFNDPLAMHGPEGFSTQKLRFAMSILNTEHIDVIGHFEVLSGLALHLGAEVGHLSPTKVITEAIPSVRIVYEDLGRDKNDDFIAKVRCQDTGREIVIKCSNDYLFAA